MATEVEKLPGGMDEDVEVETPEQVKQRAMRQVEFYLSDSNLPFDRYLWNMYDKTSTHWIPIKELASFKRMRQFEVHGPKWLLEALRASKVLEVDSTGENVRRTSPLVERPRETIESRSVYAKGFPAEYPNLQADLERFFARFGVISAVRMRREDNKTFKGSVFCEYSEVESALRFLGKGEGKDKDDDKDGSKTEKRVFKGNELAIMSKLDYIKMKCAEKGIEPDTPSVPTSKPKFNAFKLMKKEGRTDSDPRPEIKSKGKDEPVTKTFSILGQELLIVSPATGEEAGKWKLENPEELEYVPGAMVAFTYENAEEELKMGALKASARGATGLPSYVINAAGESTGHVVFQKSITDEQFEKLKKETGDTYSWTRLEEDEEKRLQREYVEQSIQRRGDDNDGSGRGGRQGRGGRGGRGGGRGGRGRGGRGGGGRGGGRDGGRDRDGGGRPGQKSRKDEREEAPAEFVATDRTAVDTDATKQSAKRKRDGEPDGPAMEDRGGAPVTIKKARVE